MKNFNLKAYHVRGMNAETEAEKLAINQELKELYDSLSEEDQKDFNEVLNAMRAVKISDEDQFNIFKIVAGILHLGNVNFVSNGNYAQPENIDGN